MIIGIDGNEANVEHRVGIGEYCSELLKQFAKYQISNIKYQIYLKDSPREDLPKEREDWQYRIVGPRKLWTQIGLPLDLYIHKPRPDVFFTPTHYAPRFSPIPTVISIMDLSYIHYPKMFRSSDLYQLRNWTAYSVNNAKRVLTISAASKDDIIRVYNVPSEKVVVTYPGIKMQQTTNNKQQTTKILKKYGIEGDYVLFVGTLQPRKNVTRLIEAFSKVIQHYSSNGVRSSRSRSNNNNLQLVLAGKKGWLYEEIFEAPKKFGVEGHVRFLDYVPDEDLPVLYKHAKCFVLPSLYEGFGLPVLEAMANGCPVVISSTSSLPEVGGDAAEYVDPENVESITSGMKRVLTNTSLRRKLIERGYKQVKKFSWEKTARQTLKVLEEVGRDRK